MVCTLRPLTLFIFNSLRHLSMPLMSQYQSFSEQRKLLIYKHIYYATHSHSIVAGGLPEMS